MRRYRYLIVAYHKDTADALCVENGLFKNHLPIHELLHEYHYTRIDDEHVLVNAEYPVSHHHLIDKHPHTLMLPSISSGKALHTHAVFVSLKGLNNKQKHVQALMSRYKLDPTHTMSDLLEKIEEHEGPLLMPIR